ncbi:hypothetical protein D3C81_2002180 [compost metagenome]
MTVNDWLTGTKCPLISPLAAFCAICAGLYAVTDVSLDVIVVYGLTAPSFRYQKHPVEIISK